jgi:hypothetical protein
MAQTGRPDVGAPCYVTPPGTLPPCGEPHPNRHLPDQFLNRPGAAYRNLD